MSGKMRRHTSLLSCVILLCLSQHARAQQTVVAASRSIDWSQAGVPGGIPNRTTICATFNPGATAAQINGALKTCTNGVVNLTAGTYNITGIYFGGGTSNVTLRGAGADKTFLIFTGSAPGCSVSADACMEGSDNNWAGGPSNTANWTAGFAKGTTVITLDNTANLSVGKAIALDQQDDLSDGGTIYVCEQSASISPNQNPPCNDDSGATGGDSGGQRGGGTPTVRGQVQIVTVTAINGARVTISPGLYMPNWRTSQSPGAWWATSPSSGLGLEDLSMDHSAVTDVIGVGIKNCTGCWVSGVRSSTSGRAHVQIKISSHTTVRNSYFYLSQNSATQSYGVEVYPGSDALIENNIFQKVEGPLKMNADCPGCVLGYNFSINDYYTPSLSWLNQSTGFHSVNDNILAEGNVGSGIYMDLFHGTHNFNTLFRNRWDGFESNGGTVTQGHTNAIILYPFARYTNVLGNVLGDAARHTLYQYTTTPAQSAGDLAVYLLGTGPTTCCQSGDPLVVSTLFRWGNYDTVNNAVRFVSSEVPSGLSLYANPVPASQTLPASFYLSARPGWWGTMPWPAIGPDVTGGDIPGVAGHAYKIPAQVCYVNMGGLADGTGPILTFNASGCYSGSHAAPSAPTSLQIR
jgi:hypothetical protein